MKAGTKHEPVLSFGKLTLKNPELKELTCENFAATDVWNETTEGTERAFWNGVGYATWECKAALPCDVTNERGEEKEGTFLSAEGPPTYAEALKETRRSGNTSLPWTGELIEKGKQHYILTHHVKLWLVVPLDTADGGPGKGAGCELLGGDEIPFEDQEGPTEKAAGDELSLKMVNGLKNGLSPSHNVIVGEHTEKGGAPETGRLISPLFGPGYVGAELVFAGAPDFELITAE